MRRKQKTAIFTLIPVLMAFAAGYFKSLWLIPAAVVMIFILVGTLPVCRKHENLWVFVLTAVCALPVNWFLINHFDAWQNYLYSGSGSITSLLVTCEYVLILTGVWEVILGLVARLLWRKQYRLYLPHDDEE